MKLYPLVLLILFNLIGFAVFGENPDTGNNDKSYIEEWRNTLRFGISDQILEVIKSISDANEARLNDELVSVLSKTLNADVKKQILDYFINSNYKGASDLAVKKIEAYEGEDREFITQLIRYLGAIKSDYISKMADKFVDLADDGLSIATIQAIGKVKDVSKGKILLSKLLDGEFPHGRKTQVIFALGELSYQEAVPALIDIVKDKEEDKGMRMFACEALGKIKDPRAIPELKNVFAENDALLKVFAASALSSFDMSEVLDLLVEGLKDANWKVRVESAKALKKKDAGKAFDILSWKVKNDPVKDVKIESMRALSGIGGGRSFDVLREIAISDSQNTEVREAALDLCIKKDLSGSMDMIKTIIARDSSKPPNKQKFLEIAASHLAGTSSFLLSDFFSQFMESKSHVLRAYGIRGAAFNKFILLKGKITDLAKNDPASNVRREAELALGKY
jgi:HEAT repeat protein